MSPSRQLLFALTLMVALGAWALGAWQLDRLVDRRAHNRRAMTDAAADPADLSTTRLTPPVSHRRAAAVGVYDSGREFIIRGRLLRGTPGVQVVTPLRLPGSDTVLLVNRGFVPTPDAGAPGTRVQFAEPGSTQVDGIAVDVPDESDGHPLATAAGETWGRLDLTQMRARLPYPIWPYYLIAGVDSTKTRAHTIRGQVLPVRIDVPPLDDGPHLLYAVQWFAIGGAALGFGVVFVRRGRRESDVVPG